MWFSIAWRVVISCAWAALILTLAFPLVGAAGWLSDKIEGGNPGTLRKGFATMMMTFLGILIVLSANASVWGPMLFFVWRPFLQRQ